MSFEIFFLIALVLLSGFFSGAEIALFSLSEAKMRMILERGKKNAEILEALKAQPQRLLITILIGNNLINIGASSLATVVAIEKMGSAGAGVATGIMTFLILFFGEIIPKSIAQRNPEKVSLLISPWMRFIKWALIPFVWLMYFLSVGFQKMVGAKKLPSRVSEEDVKAMVDLSHEEGGVRKNEKEMIEKVFLLDDITAADVMTPKDYMVGFDAETTLASAIPIIEESGYSRFPVLKKNGEVEGIVYIKDVFAYIADRVSKAGDQCEKDNKEIMEERIATLAKSALYIPVTMHVDDLMKDFQKKRKHIAIVVDEYGATHGLVTLEDLLEEIVGEIIDETDVDENLIKRIDEKTIMVDTRVSIGKVNWFFNSELPGPEQKTVGWLVLKQFGRIPEKGASTTIENYKFIVEEAEDRRIKRLLMIKRARAKANDTDELLKD